MFRFIVQRLLLGLLTLIVLTAISWIIIELPPGDFVDMYVEELLGGGGDYSAGAGYIGEVMEKNLRQQYGLDAPTHVRYGKWMWRMLHGDLGNSTEYENQ